ncbi:TetR/AcrR family transcriptional regulator [Streptomyces sp. CA-294286]|uniref:TetR/AcrR family transcriptional regulator n=1 Tax=Streptomyces sp. CA-294286 TaxID=3240070 RepID=UPI003D8B6889
MVPAADRVKKPGLSSVWLAEKSPRGGGGGKDGSGARSGGPRDDDGARSAGSGRGSGGGAAGTGRRAADPDRRNDTGLDRDRITATTVALLDADGLAKFSMRRLAAELNVTAMSVYWYVANKDDLLELAVDHVAAELDLPDPEDDTDWRVQLRQLAQSYRELLVRHPWVAPLIGRFLNIGPCMRAFSDATLRLMRKTGVPKERHGGTTAAVFQFVYGFATSEAQYYQLSAEAGVSPDAFFREAMGVIAGELAGSQLLRDSTEVMEARGGDTVAEMYGRDFDNALDVLIRGIEATSADA